MKKNILLIISIVIFIAAILTSGAMTNWWQGESKNITPTPEPTPTAVPTATPTVAPTATPKPTPKPKAAFKNLSELKSAVSAYFDNASQKWTAIGNSENLKNHNVPNTDTTYYEYYGPIEDWNTSQVTDMSGLFQGHGEFNGDISKWNTSSVTNMKNMFYNAQKFNQDITPKPTLDMVQLIQLGMSVMSKIWSLCSLKHVNSIKTSIDGIPLMSQVITTKVECKLCF